MNYDLAKKLKDAGFPQVGNGDVLMLHNPDLVEGNIEDQTISRVPYYQYVLSVKSEYYNRYGDDVYDPTLSELIEACGEKFTSLIRNNGDYNCWVASWNNFKKGDKIMGMTTTSSFISGGARHTPEEAVANLYLELKK